MPDARFLQIHTLHGYPAVLLNRDDTGQAKRLPYGGAMRIRISSQCLKRHWRVADDVHALDRIDGAEAAVRSREIVTKRLRRPLEDRFAPEILDAIDGEFQKAVYGKEADKGKSKRQPLLFGEPEIRFLEARFAEIAQGARDPMTARTAAAAFCNEASFRETMKAMRASAAIPGGLTAAMFGRMVTSDPDASIDAPVHVAHAFTVHGEETESDYFSVVDDLRDPGEAAGADHIGEAELTSGLFYGYVVIDIRGLLSNLAGDLDLAAEVTRRLVHLIAEISPGAKLGSTAPYGYAATMMIEAGDRQPRNLAEAFRTPCRPRVADAEAAMDRHLAVLDKAYETGEVRRFMSLRNDAGFSAAEQLSLPSLAKWAAAVVHGSAV